MDDAPLDIESRPAFRLAAQSLGGVDNPANALFPAYSSPAVDNVPNWQDLNPRIGAAYDLFGDGRTALKGGINRYVAGASTTVAQTFGPTANFSTTRNWTDANGNFSPDCDLKNPARAGSARAPVVTSAAPTTTRASATFSNSTSVPDPAFIGRLGEARIQLAGDGQH